MTEEGKPEMFLTLWRKQEPLKNTCWQLEKTLNKVCLGANLSQFLSRYAIYSVWQPLRSDYRINRFEPECEMIQLKP